MEEEEEETVIIKKHEILLMKYSKEIQCKVIKKQITDFGEMRSNIGETACHFSVCLFTHSEQRGPCGTGFVWYALLSCEDVLEILPHLFVEDHMEEEDEDSL